MGTGECYLPNLACLPQVSKFVRKVFLNLKKKNCRVSKVRSLIFKQVRRPLFPACSEKHFTHNLKAAYEVTNSMRRDNKEWSPQTRCRSALHKFTLVYVLVCFDNQTLLWSFADIIFVLSERFKSHCSFCGTQLPVERCVGRLPSHLCCLPSQNKKKVGVVCCLCVVDLCADYLAQQTHSNALSWTRVSCEPRCSLRKTKCSCGTVRVTLCVVLNTCTCTFSQHQRCLRKWKDTSALSTRVSNETDFWEMLPTKLECVPE